VKLFCFTQCFGTDANSEFFQGALLQYAIPQSYKAHTAQLWLKLPNKHDARMALQLTWLGCKPDATNTRRSLTFGHKSYVVVLDVRRNVLLIQAAGEATGKEVGHQASVSVQMAHRTW